jgi:hypothetical protein
LESLRRLTSEMQNCRQRKLQSNDKSPLSGAKKHPDFQVTACYHFVTTIVNFVYIRSEIMPIFYKYLDIS